MAIFGHIENSEKIWRCKMSPAKIKKNKEMQFMIHWCAYYRQAEENKRVIDHSRDKLNTYIQ